MIQRNLPRTTQPSASRANRDGLSVPALIVGSVLWLLVLAALWLLAARRAPNNAATSPTPSQDASTQENVTDPVPATTKTIRLSFPARPLPDFSFPECQGGTLSLADLKGKRWLANFVFTRCQGPCPTMTRDISELHRRVAKSNPDFLFVTFSVDSSYDSAEVLKKYAETFQADPARWKFLTGDELAIHDLIRRGFSLYVQPNLGEMRKPGFEVAHSNRAVLVNEDGIPVGTWLMTIPEDVVKLRRVIEGKVEFPKPGPLLQTPADGQNPPVNFNLVPAETTSDSPEPAPNDDGKQPDSDPAAPAPSAPQDSQSSGNSAAATTDPPPSSSTTPDAAPSTPPRQLSTVERNREIDQKLPDWVKALPSVNALLNLICTCLLVAGYIAIKGEPDEKAAKKLLHRNLMIAAFGVSVVFLCSYLTYHEALYQWSGQRGRAFVGSEFARILYFSILIPHVILAAFVPFLALRVFYLAWKERWDRHRKLAKITLPIWLFVSITGVLVYGMLYHWPWSTLEPTLAEPGTAI
jgi:uncharacterized membrane protein YozB (DUF420 family)/cytochrome oxidase Cu insertion factor (SCO1/SenC/PrrC family)